MRRHLHLWFALLLALLLVSGQQAALAHILGHAMGAAAIEVVQDEDADHGTTLARSHACTNCIAFAGVDATPAASTFVLAPAADRVAAPAIAVPPAPTLGFSAAFRSRAPPLL